MTIAPEREASLYLRRLLREQAAAIIANPLINKAYQDLGPGEAVAEYLAWKRLHGAAETLRRYEGILARLCVKYPEQQLEDFDSGQLLRFIQAEFEEGSQSLVASCLRDFWRWAQLWKRLDANPMDLIRVKKNRSMNRVYDVFSLAERAKMLAACTGQPMEKRDRAGILLFDDTGGRKNDVRMLQWRDVDLVERQLVFRHRKGGGEMVTDFTERTQAALLDLYHSRLPRVDRPLGAIDYVLFPHRMNEWGVIWADPSKPMSTSTMQRWWVDVLDRAGVPHRKLHMMRHTHGTELYEATGDIYAVSERLGHASVTTSQIYVHQSPRKKKAGLVALEAYRAALENVPIHPVEE